MRKIYDFFGGRTTIVAGTLLFSGLIGFFTHRLSGTEFVAFGGMLQGFMTWHSKNQGDTGAGS